MNESQYEEIDIRAILGLLQRQFRLIIAVILIALGIAGIALFALKPIYTASALVLVDPSKKDLLVTAGIDTGGAAASARIDSEVEILKSSATLLSVIDQQKLITDAEFGIKLGTYDRLLTKLGLASGNLPVGDQALRNVLTHVEDALSVRRRGLTYLISVSFSAQSPVRAADLANAVTRAYIANQLATKVQGALAVRDILDARIAEAGEAISHSELVLGEYVFSNIERISAQTGNGQLSVMRQRLTSLKDRAQDVDRLKGIVDRGVRAADWTKLSHSLGLEAVVELEAQRQRLIGTLAQSSEGEDVVVDLRQELAAIEKQMSEKAKSELVRLGQSALALQAESVDLRSQIRVSAISSDLPADMVTEIFELQQNASEARRQYQTLLSRLREVETQVDLQIADSVIVSAALPPGSPSFPNKKLIFALAGMAGLGLGVGLAFLNEYYVGGFTSLGQIEAILKVPVLAALPKLKANALAGAHPTDSLLIAPLSSFSESIRRIRASIDRALDQRADLDKAETVGSIIMVCSAVPGEGKTTTALSLARAYSLSGQHTLLIDADMRHPAIQSELGVANGRFGLFEILSGSPKSVSLSSALIKDKKTDLQILVGSNASSVPTDRLFAGKKFADILDKATNVFDVVILDTPPVGPVVDALYLAQYADFLLYVVRWASSPQREVLNALTRLQETLGDGAQSGVVLNQQDDRFHGYRSNYAGYYDEQ